MQNIVAKKEKKKNDNDIGIRGFAKNYGMGSGNEHDDKVTQ